MRGEGEGRLNIRTGKGMWKGIGRVMGEGWAIARGGRQGEKAGQTLGRQGPPSITPPTAAQGGVEMRGT